MRKFLPVLVLAAVLVQPATAQNFKWLQVSPENPKIWYSVGAADKQASTVAVTVAFMRRPASPAVEGNTGTIRTEVILCAKGGYEDTHQAVDGSMHAADDSFQAFDFKEPGAMEVISSTVCPRG